MTIVTRLLFVRDAFEYKLLRKRLRLLLSLGRIHRQWPEVSE